MSILFLFIFCLLFFNQQPTISINHPCIKKTSVSKFLTNSLFGMNKLWNGKQFSSVNDEFIGINRFHEENRDSITNVHKFDYSIEPSIFGKSSIRLNYSRHQGMFSLWKTMVDEVRLLKVPRVQVQAVDKGGGEIEEKFDVILLGIGSMAWSGGMYNGQPFCLYQPSVTSKSALEGSSADALLNTCTSDTPDNPVTSSS